MVRLHADIRQGPTSRYSINPQEEYMAQLALDFAYSDGQIQLEKTVFKFGGDCEHIAVRGKAPGAYNGPGSFQWTPAVKAVCVLFLSALARTIGGADNTALPPENILVLVDSMPVHDHSNFICIKGTNEPVMGYYIMFLLKPEAMRRFLSGELLEDDVRTNDLIAPTADAYKNQTDAHICVFASKRHASLFTIDLPWHLLVRIIYLAEFGSLSKIYAEATTIEGERILKRFNFKPATNVNHSGDPLFETTITPEIIAQWNYWYSQRSFAQATAPELALVR